MQVHSGYNLPGASSHFKVRSDHHCDSVSSPRECSEGSASSTTRLSSGSSTRLLSESRSVSQDDLVEVPISGVVPPGTVRRRRVQFEKNRTRSEVFQGFERPVCGRPALVPLGLVRQRRVQFEDDGMSQCSQRGPEQETAADRKAYTDVPPTCHSNWSPNDEPEELAMRSQWSPLPSQVGEQRRTRMSRSLEPMPRHRETPSRGRVEWWPQLVGFQPRITMPAQSTNLSMRHGSSTPRRHPSHAQSSARSLSEGPKPVRTPSPSSFVSLPLRHSPAVSSVADLELGGGPACEHLVGSWRPLRAPARRGHSRLKKGQSKTRSSEPAGAELSLRGARSGRRRLRCRTGVDKAPYTM
uniref:Uncharacterized protein n=1 Tax=Noctiluca scintillans TaxID=2966 RepID=A0A7S1A017_NOCSC|mmetsp:Transcript_25680/g.67179  ORF Transcript_25680/g.67179 Transcript_25680/m.67179 type:complete len:354 (+) Transcript_25680:74-1135(+)